MKRRRAGAQIVAAIVWLVMMLLITGQVAVYSIAFAAERNVKKGSAQKEDDVEFSEESGSSVFETAKPAFFFGKSEKKETPQERKARLTGHSKVWLVVVSLVLLTAGVVKSNDHFYKKYREKEEEKAKAKGRMI